MTEPGSEADRLVEHLFRRTVGPMIARLTRHLGAARLQLAEDAVQAGFLRASQLWPYRGIPDNPEAWLWQVARNEAIDVLRRERRGAPLAGEALARLEALEAPAPPAADPLADDELRLMLLLGHPALAPESQVTLILKVAAGFGVGEIARGLRLPESTVAQRLVRARRRLRGPDIGLDLPAGTALEGRIDSVLTALYLMFNEGYSASRGEDLVRHDFCHEAIRLGGLLARHASGDRPRVHALLALFHFQASRLKARVSPGGDLLLLAEQDRALWDHELIDRGLRHLDRAARGSELTAWHLEAAIAARHAVAADASTTDWVGILEDYTELQRISPSPIVTLNRAVALAMVEGPEAGLTALDGLDDAPGMRGYHLLPATRGLLLQRSGRSDAGRAALLEAADLAGTTAERAFLLRRAAVG